MGHATKQSSSDEEMTGLMGMATKGISKAGQTLSSLGGTAKAAVGNARERVQDITLSRDRLIWFGVSAGVGTIFMFLAFMFLPM